MDGYGPLGVMVGIGNLRSSVSLSHLVVLAALAKLLPLKRVLEFGSGEWSTSFFLNKDVFPNLEYLESYETSKDWYDHVFAQVISDPRVNLLYVNKPNLNAASIDLSTFDLCLIDSDGATRGAVINTLVARCPDNLLIVIHDYENPNHKITVENVQPFVITQVAGPQTALVWRGDRINRDELTVLISTIK